MNKIGFMLSLAVAGLAAGAAEDPKLADTTGKATAFDGYELSWSDEFNGKGTRPDASKWDYELGTSIRNSEDQTYTRDNAVCKDGRLVITAKKEGNYYTSSSLVTKGLYNFLYGKYVFRARIPMTQGTWPCMWMMGKNYTWPSGGEIDIQEAFWQYGEPYLKCNLCWNGTKNMTDAKWNSRSYAISSFDDPEWGAKYHTWVMDWDKDYIRIYLDGTLLREQKLDSAINGGEWGEGTQGKCPFREPQYILLNLALGGVSARPIDDSKLPATLEVDYVRVYRKVGTKDGPQPDTIDLAPGTGAKYEPVTTAPQDLQGYNLAWNDEFDVKGSPSKTHWAVDKGSSATVEGGLLKMPTDNYKWAYLTTYGKHGFTKGIIEVRARLPIKKGLKASIFTTSKDAGKSPYGYAEIFENRYLSGSSVIATWLDWKKSSYWYDRTLTWYTDRNDYAEPKWAAQFHVWRYIVDDENVKITVDGETFFKRARADMKDGTECPFGSETNPHYFGISMAFDNESELDLSTPCPTFEIDYVRCYEPNGEPIPSDPEPIPGAISSAYLTDYLHLGANFDKDDLAEFAMTVDPLSDWGGESKQHPYAGLGFDGLSTSSTCTSGDRLVWTPVHRDDGVFSPSGRDRYTKYFHVYLNVPGTASRTAKVYLRQDDDVRIWNNGSLVVSSDGYDKGSEKGPFTVTLAPGENAITVRLREGTGGDSFAMRLTDENGKAFTDVVASLVSVNGAPEGSVERPNITGVSIVDGSVRVSVDNAVKGARYGYKYADTLEKLKTAKPVWLDSPAKAAGVLHVQPDGTHQAGFYQIVVDW